MAVKILMPKLGLTMETGTITKWLKAEGESVAEGEGIVEIETDKISNTVEATTSGVLLKILVQEGEEAEILSPIGVIGQPGESW
jgi:pyruvate dehydrogenase E2 component (dihydrolipoamide acetyltransferase)